MRTFSTPAVLGSVPPLDRAAPRASAEHAGRRGSPGTVGIVGAGAFGRFAARHLAADFAVTLADPDPDARDRAAADGLAVGELSDVAGADIVVLAVPWRRLAEVAAAIAPLLTPAAIVVDVSSIKVAPLAALRAALPGRTIVGLHPLFGPQSGAHGLAGLPIAHCTGGTGADRRIARYLERRLKLRRIAVSAEEHDREMGRVQGLTHVIARALTTLRLAETPLATRSFSHLARMVDIVGRDSEAVFRTIVADNPHAGAAARAFEAALAAIVADLPAADPDSAPVSRG
jgi:prephenate dehydrogenase